MRPLALEEIAGLDAYADVRDAYRAALIDHKRHRRMPVGDKVTLVFEDRETLRFQVQEMLWIERIGDPGRVQYELDVYNELMPGSLELSATLFVEITEAASIRAELDRLIGIDEHVSLVLGDGAGAREVVARFDEKQLEEDRISAVQYLRFALDRDAAKALADPETPAGIRIAHPSYAVLAAIPPEVRISLARGLETEPSCLLPEPLPATEPSAEPEVVFQQGRVRAVVARRARVPGHLVVEVAPPAPDWSAVDPALAAELMAALQQVASAMVERHGGCRIESELHANGPWRWHLLPRLD